MSRPRVLPSRVEENLRFPFIVSNLPKTFSFISTIIGGDYLVERIRRGFMG